MALSRKRIEDVDTLRAFVHPLRLRLLGSLRVEGPATASELGRRFGESSGSTSYHLRQLARFGFVVEDADQPSKRERRWRAAHDVTTWRNIDFLGDEVGRETIHTLQREQLRYLVDNLQRWYAEQDTWPAEWVDAAEHSDMHLRLRPDELRAMSDELDAVIQRYVENQRSDDDPAAARVAVHLVTYPRERPTR
ncbi:MAG: winged helix-turn-helix domain-containing protein [Jiangellaceae bacterium]